jgi:hypothetical protein
VESLRITELVAVSRYWTPAHIDVTDAPLVYAKPKGDWLTRLPHPLAPVDDADRFRRRAVSSRLIVDTAEIPELPELDLPPVEEPPTVEQRWREWRAAARHLLQRFAYR